MAILQDAMAEEMADTQASLVLLELTPGTGDVRVLLAGHPPPWLRRGEDFSEVEAPENILLGVRSWEHWESIRLRLEPGDGLLVFTDGLTDARIRGHEFFGEGPFQRMLDRLPPTLRSSDLVVAIDAEMERVGAALTDDMIISALTFDPLPLDPEPTAGG